MVCVYAYLMRKLVHSIVGVEQKLKIMRRLTTRLAWLPCTSFRSAERRIQGLLTPKAAERIMCLKDGGARLLPSQVVAIGLMIPIGVEAVGVVRHMSPETVQWVWLWVIGGRSSFQSGVIWTSQQKQLARKKTICRTTTATLTTTTQHP